MGHVTWQPVLEDRSTGVGECERPNRMELRTYLSNGQVEVKTVYLRCNSRLATQCPSCSALYVGDVKAVTRAGLMAQPGGSSPSVTFITLTAPGGSVFGHTHSANSRRSKKGKRYVQRCKCGKYHRPDSTALGTPVNAGTFRYDLVTSFNASASRLFSVTLQKLARVMGLDKPPAVERTVEYQVRGLVHFHALVRAEVTQEMLDLVVSGGTNPATGRPIRPVKSNGWGWGPQCKADRFDGDDPRLGSYITKMCAYATKAVAESIGDVAKNDFTSHPARLRRAARKTCVCSSDEAAEFCKVANPDLPHKHICRRHRLAERGLGFRGHVFAVSRSWPSSLGKVRAVRRAHNWSVLPDDDVIDTEWKRMGSGYTIDGLTLTQLRQPPAPPPTQPE